ncbi:MAG: acetyltransferase [Enterocloster sp.]
MKKLVILGSGGHCKSVYDVVLSCGGYDEVVIVSEKADVGKKILGCPVVGTDENLDELYKAGYRYAFIAVGSIKTTDLRRKLWNKVKKKGYILINVIDKSAIIASDVKLGEGLFIGKKSVVNAGVKIGDMAIINTGAIIEHDCVVGEFTHVSVGAVLCGGVKIGKDCFIGANSTIIQERFISDNSVIGAGETVRYTSKEFIRSNKVNCKQGEGGG